MKQILQVGKRVYRLFEIIALLFIIPIYTRYLITVDDMMSSFDVASINLLANFLGTETKSLLKIIFYPLLGIFVLLRIVLQIMHFRKVSKQRREEFLLKSKVAEAVILTATENRSNHPRARPHAILCLKVNAGSEAEFETYIEIPINMLAIPKVGDILQVRYNPDDHDQIELADGKTCYSGKHMRMRLALVERRSRS